MKKLLVVLSFLSICTFAIAHTIEWYVGNQVYQTTTCNSGDNITPPTAPEKYGYHFVEWDAGYTKLEYIESTGTQYLQGNISELTYSTEIKVDVYSYQYIADGGFFGLYNSASTDRSFFAGYGFNNAIFVASYPETGYTFAPGTAVAGDHTIERKSNGDIYVDGSKITNKSLNNRWEPFTDMTSFVVGKSSLSGTALLARYKRVTIKNKLDLIPCRRNSDNVLGMYDLVSGQFFTNAGTGEFIAGPEVGNLQ